MYVHIFDLVFWPSYLGPRGACFGKSWFFGSVNTAEGDVRYHRPQQRRVVVVVSANNSSSLSNNMQKIHRIQSYAAVLSGYAGRT